MKTQSRGFTLIEISVGMMAFVLLIVVVGTFQRDVFSLNSLLHTSLSSQREARIALKTITAEVRSASPSGSGAYPVATAGDSELTFYADIDDDGITERIRYFLDDTMLRRGRILPAGTPVVYDPATEDVTDIVHDVANGADPVFAYYDASYDGMTAPLSQPVDVAAIRLVKVTVTVDRDADDPPPPVTLSSQVSLRNIKDNL